MEKYDSKEDTLKHIENVRHLLNEVVNNLILRAADHDYTKLVEPEKSIFDAMTPKLAGCTYGSDEYKGYLEKMGEALTHHYACTKHHPESFEDGIKGMSLLDLVEMIVDWKAATLRHNDGNIMRSVEINQIRFGYSDELKQIFLNTISELNLEHWEGLDG